MKKINLVLTLLFTFVFMKFSLAGSLESITLDQAFKLQNESKAMVIDVREPIEVSAGKIKGAITLPMSLMNNDRANWDKKIAEFTKDKPVIVYCHSGRRADLVGSELIKKGFKVSNLGGFDAWKSKGLPID